MTTTNDTPVKQRARSLESALRALMTAWVGVWFVYTIVQFNHLNPVLMIVWLIVFAVMLVVVNVLHAKGKP